MQEAEALIILKKIKGIGPVALQRWITKYGAATAILQQPIDRFSAEEQLSANVCFQLSNWQQNTSWKKELELVEHHQVSLVCYCDPLFPQSLLQIPNPPSLLYVKGELKPSDTQAIAIVGTRNASLYGQEMAKKFSSELASAGYTIVSGLARGIDTHAHRAALRWGRTLTVIGSGLSKIYPSENQNLADEISRSGAILSEFGMDTPPDRQNFPQRNRLVSGLSKAVVLIEAPLGSGALLTLHQATLQKKDIFALPGRIDVPSFHGNHAWIKSGKARLVETAAEVAQSLDGQFSLQPQPPPSSAAPKHAPLHAQEQQLYDSMPPYECSIDELCLQTKFSPSQLTVLLMSLQLKKAVQAFPGAFYKKVEPRG